MTATATRSGSCSCAPGTRPGASWPRRCCASTAATRSRSTAPAPSPRGINPLTLRVLAEAGIDASWARSKSVDEFLGQSFDYVVTVCDEARQVCPVFPGVHESLHWGYEDPAEAEGTEEERLAVFREVFIQLGERIQQFATVTRAAARLMLLHLLRHADAGDPEAWTGPDAARPLSDKGRAQAERLGAFLAEHGFKTDAAHHLAQAAGRADGRDRRAPSRHRRHGGRAAGRRRSTWRRSRPC